VYNIPKSAIYSHRAMSCLLIAKQTRKKKGYTMSELKPFYLSDQNAVDALANELERTTSGWLDREIESKSRELISKEYLPNGTCKEESKFKVFWLHITTKCNAVAEIDPFIRTQKEVHLGNCKKIGINIKEKQIGELLYYSFEKSRKKGGVEVGIEGFVKVYKPLEHNIEEIKRRFRDFLNTTPNMFGEPWVADIQKFTIEDYRRDIEKTLSNKYNDLFGI